MVRFDANQLEKQGVEALGLNVTRDFSHLDRNRKYPIETLVEFIRSKGYGIDVRESIAKGFERVYEDATKNGNANFEVSAARGSYNQLSARLTAMDNNLENKAPLDWVKEQLENAIGGGPVAVLADLPAIQRAYPTGTTGIVVASGNGHWYYWSSSARQWQDGGVYKAQGLNANEVNADNLDFTDGVKQMLDLNAVFRGRVHLWGNNGMGEFAEGSSTSYPSIRLLAGKTYYLHNVRGVFTFYVSLDGKRLLKKFSERDGTISQEYTPTEDGILYVSSNAGNQPQVFNTSQSQLTVLGVDLKEIHQGYISIKIPKLALDVDVEELNFLDIYESILDPSKATKGKYYTGNGTNTGNSANWAVYPPITLQAGKKYAVSGARGIFSYYQRTNGTTIRKLSEKDEVVNLEFTADEAGVLLISTDTSRDKSAPVVVAGGNAALKALESTDFGSKVALSKFPISFPGKKTEYHVKKDGTGDFTNLADAVREVGPGIPSARNTIYIHSGEYNILEELGGDQWLQIVERTNSERLGIELPDYVDVVGIGDVVLRLEVPDDKTTTNTAKRISLLNLWRNNTVKNLKMYTRNTRYVVHDETNNSYHHNNVKYIDCYLEQKGNKAGVWNSNQAYAAGTGSGGQYLFEGCTFKSTSIPFSMHDNHNVEGNTIKIRNCTFISGDSETAIRFGSYGNNAKMSSVSIENCNIDKAIKLFEEQTNSRHGNHFKVSGGGNTVVPYININSAGRKERVEFGDEVRVLRNSGQSEIGIGTPVKLSGSTVQALGADEPWLFYGVALDTIRPGETGVIKYRGYIAKEDTGLSALSAGQRIGLVGGRLAVVTDGDFIGYATDGNNILLKK
ncbi:hypothetical protein HZZ02_05505 [Streptococcus danieliae]|nr:hypothetical protein [Streptococcus danieliae]